MRRASSLSTKSWGKTVALPPLLNTHFFRSIRWNALDACVYQGVLTIHYAALFYVTEPAFFGAMGTLFSLVFLLATIANVGLDGTLSTFFTRACVTQVQVRSIIIRHLGATALVALTLGLFALRLATYLPRSFPPLSPALSLIILLILVCESIKKSVRMLLQLSFQAPTVAVIESATVIGYVGWVWLDYAMGLPFTLMHLFFPMVICWLASTAAFTWASFQFYRRLPLSVSAHEHVPISHARITKNRFFNLLNQLVHQLFSSNFLVPFFAMRGGFSLAGLLKLVCYLSYGLTSVIQKMIGFSASALLAQTIEQENMRHAFFLANKTLLRAMWLILFLATLIITGLFLRSSLHVTPPASSMLCLLFFIFLIQISENFFTVYERLLIVRERTFFLAFLNGSTTLALYGVLRVTGQAPLLVTLSLMLFIRLLAFYLLRIRAKHELAVPKTLATQKLIPESYLKNANKNKISMHVFCDSGIKPLLFTQPLFRGALRSFLNRTIKIHIFR